MGVVDRFLSTAHFTLVKYFHKLTSGVLEPKREMYLSKVGCMAVIEAFASSSISAREAGLCVCGKKKCIKFTWGHCINNLQEKPTQNYNK